MNSTGKKMRAQKGQNRHELHHANHAHKRKGKVFNNAKKNAK